ncbi:MAG: SRPBCC family protein [Bacteroidota bacterium]
MKKMIVTIVIAVVLVFLGIGSYNASKLQEIHIQKTVTVNADIETVYNNVAYLSNFPKWSPFLEADPTQKTEVKGTDGQIGAQYHWVGNKGKDVGYQEITRIEANKYVKMECDIQKPFKAQPTFEYTFEQNNETVTVTQDFNLKSGFVDAFFMGLFGAKKEMDKVNARGMELLKKVSEE